MGNSAIALTNSLVRDLGGPSGFGEFAVPRSDDDQESPNVYDISSVFEGGIKVGDNTYYSIYVNTNGNITFGDSLTTFTPESISGNTNGIIAPFWADVDTRSPASEGRESSPIYVDLDTARDVVTITWQGVNFFNRNGTKQNDFQLQLFDRDRGNFDIVFRYEDIEWTSGDASDGVPARAGYNLSDGKSVFELPQSGRQTEILELENTVGNSGFAGLWIFSVRNGTALGDGTTDSVVNTEANGNQDRPAAAALSGGRHVVTWTSADGQGGDPTGSSIRARIFAADGSPVGSDFLVNSTTAADQSASSVAALPDGRFMITWHSYDRQGSDSSFSGIRGRLFSADGRPAGEDFVVNTTTDSFQERPSVAALAGGRFLVTWQSFDGQGADTALSGLRGRLFSAEGLAIGDDFNVNSETAGFQFSARTVALTDGRFLVAWESFDGQGEDRSGSAIRGRIFSADGLPAGPDFVLNGVTSGDQLAPALTALPGGRFMAVWQTGDAAGEDTSATAIRARIFEADGKPAGADFVVNSSTVGRQELPAVAALADGRILVTWSSADGQGGDTSSTGIRGRLFAPDGTPDGKDFILNTTTRDSQGSPVVVAIADGRFQVAWQSFDGEGSDISGSNIRSRSLSLDPFDSWSYLASHDDLIRAFGSRQAAGPEHYALYGFREGRARDSFDEWSYLASYDDLIRAFGPSGPAAAEHFVTYGFREGRARDGFDEWSYLASHDDLIRAFGPDGPAAAAHYVRHGLQEGRARDSFDEWSYIASHSDLIRAFGGNGEAGTEHYVHYGFTEGRAKDRFDELRYIASHKDLIAAFGADGPAGAHHFVTYGYTEGRNATAFDPARYLSKYGDLQAAFGTDTAAATLHFIHYGAAEGRSDVLDFFT